MSNLTKTLAVLSLLAPVSGYPLGIGEIKLRSALNQKLEADIPLMLSPGERISDVKVSMAAPDKFDERGVPWSYFLSNITLEPTVRADGSAIIKVRSKEALKEPILDLLLQVSWPKGTSYRVFSVFVDPPAAYAQPTIPVMQAPQASNTEQSQVSIPEQAIVKAPSYAPAPSVPKEQRKDTVSAGPTRSRQPVKGVYGPTRRSDTIWGIAAKTARAYKVPIEQTMVALYKANPKAFYKDNINALSAGVKLKVPDREAILKLSYRESITEYKRQNEEWRNRSNPVIAENEKSLKVADGLQADQQNPDNQLKLVAPAQDSVKANAVIAPGQEQNATNSDSASAKETAAEPSAVNAAEVEAKMVAMEQQLAKVQALLTIKEQQLAALQSQANPQKTNAASSSGVPDSVQKPAVSAVESGAGSAKSPENGDKISQSAQPENLAGPVSSKLPGSKQAGVPTVVTQPIVKKPVHRPVPVPQAVTEEPFPWDLLGGVLGAALVSVLGLVWWRKRKVSTDKVVGTESMFSPSIIYKAPEAESNFTAPAPVLSDGPSFEVNQVNESSFLSEFTPSDFDAFDSDHTEIDPISEADVYLAYGRYQQAEEMMRSAIKASPERDECKHKLLEIYYASENKAGFETYVNELVSAGKNSDLNFWEKVEEMGQEICPDSPLFTLKNGNSSETGGFTSEPPTLQLGKPEFGLSLPDEKSDSSFSDGFDLDFDSEFKSTEFTTEINVESDWESKDLESSAPLDLSALVSLDAPFEDETRNNDVVEFNISEFGSNNDANETDADEFSGLQLAKKSDTESAESNENEGFDFTAFEHDDSSTVDFQSETPDKTLYGENKADAVADLDQFEFELPDSGSGFREQNENSGDIDFDFDFSALQNDSDDEQGLDEGSVAGLTDLDELETKLDLAKAYRDMGDTESAKDIVAEVLEKGTTAQKKMAQELLSELM